MHDIYNVESSDEGDEEMDVASFREQVDAKPILPDYTTNPGLYTYIYMYTCVYTYIYI